jgi:hypothetical protein
MQQRLRPGPACMGPAGPSRAVASSRPRAVVVSSSVKEVTLLDYGAGNIRSVRNAIKRLGYTIKDVCRAPRAPRAALRLLPPPAGAAAAAAAPMAAPRHAARRACGAAALPAAGAAQQPRPSSRGRANPRDQRSTRPCPNFTASRPPSGGDGI